MATLPATYGAWGGAAKWPVPARSVRIAPVTSQEEQPRHDIELERFRRLEYRLPQSIGLLKSEGRESGTRAESADHTVHGDVRFAVADQNERRRRCFVGGGHGW